MWSDQLNSTSMHSSALRMYQVPRLRQRWFFCPSAMSLRLLRLQKWPTHTCRTLIRAFADAGLYPVPTNCTSTPTMHFHDFNLHRIPASRGRPALLPAHALLWLFVFRFPTCRTSHIHSPKRDRNVDWNNPLRLRCPHVNEAFRCRQRGSI